MVKIEKNVPLPPLKTYPYPWADMKIGDSFFTETAATSLSTGRAKAQKKTGFKFSLRIEGTGTRVWRIA